MGQKVGSYSKGAVDAATLLVGTGVADKAVKGSSVVKGLSEGGKIAQTTAKLAPKVAGSLAGTGIGYAQDVAAGNQSQAGKNALIGTAADIALPGLGRLGKLADTGVGKGIAKIAGEDSGKVITTIGDKGLVGAANAVTSKALKKSVYAVSDALEKTSLS